jgi:hypothetical protein
MIPIIIGVIIALGIYTGLLYYASLTESVCDLPDEPWNDPELVKEADNG